MLKEAELGSVVMLDYPATASRRACTVCGGSGRVGVLRNNETQPVVVSTCPDCGGTGNAKKQQPKKGNLQFNLRTMLITASLMPPTLAWGIWMVGVLNPLGCVFAIVPLAFYGSISALCLPFRRTRWLSVVSLVFCAISISLVMPASGGSEFQEAGLAAAILSTEVGGLVLACLATGFFVVMFAHRVCRNARGS